MHLVNLAEEIGKLDEWIKGEDEGDRLKYLRVYQTHCKDGEAL
ncbi:hypothetical protein [Salipaludibacillus keqinensis]|nr:hypothetical protein [Salipaludibacillus keqinensis]